MKDIKAAMPPMASRGDSVLRAPGRSLCCNINITLHLQQLCLCYSFQHLPTYQDYLRTKPDSVLFIFVSGAEND